MSTDAVAIIGFIALFALMLLRVPVGMAMGLVGVSGFGYLVGGTPALKLVGQTSMRTVTDYTFGVIPMFLLMGTFVSNSGMSRDRGNPQAAAQMPDKPVGGAEQVAAHAGIADEGPHQEEHRNHAEGVVGHRAHRGLADQFQRRRAADQITEARDADEAHRHA